MTNMMQEIEARFDPTDVDGAMQLAYNAGELIKLVKRALSTEYVNMKMGRDLTRDLGVAVQNLAGCLRILPSHPTGAEVDAFFGRIE